MVRFVRSNNVTIIITMEDIIDMLAGDVIRFPGSDVRAPGTEFFVCAGRDHKTVLQELAARGYDVPAELMEQSGGNGERAPNP